MMNYWKPYENIKKKKKKLIFTGSAAEPKLYIMRYSYITAAKTSGVYTVQAAAAPCKLLLGRLSKAPGSKEKIYDI